MKKSQAFELLGGTAASAARLCRITSSAVSQWGEVLTKDQLDRACAAWARENVPNLPEAFRGIGAQTAPSEPASD